MYSKFRQMLEKKRDMKPAEKHAKIGVLKDLKHSLADDMGEKLGGMKKVSVMSDSSEGLSAGLDKAQELTGGMSDGGIADSDENPASGEPTEEMEEESPAHESLESGHEMSEDMDLDEIKRRIEHLMMLQKQMEQK